MKGIVAPGSRHHIQTDPKFRLADTKRRPFDAQGWPRVLSAVSRLAAESGASLEATRVALRDFVLASNVFFFVFFNGI